MTRGELIEQFVVAQAEWGKRTTGDFGRGRAPAEVMRGDLQSVLITCRCAHEWTARRHGDGKFVPALGAIRLKCPACGTEGAVSYDAMKSS